jgi:hypothetical protein
VVCLAWLKRKSGSRGALARRQDTVDASASSMVGSLSRRRVATMFVDWVLVFLDSSPSPRNMPLFSPPSTLTLPFDIQFCHHPVPLAIAATASSLSCHLPRRLHTHPSAHLEGRHKTWLLHAYDEQQAVILSCRRTIQEAIHHMGNSFVGARSWRHGRSNAWEVVQGLSNCGGEVTQYLSFCISFLYFLCPI